MTKTKTQEKKYILLSHEEWAEKMKIEGKRHKENYYRDGSERLSIWWELSGEYEEQSSSSWGDWYFDKKGLYLDLLPNTNWTHEEPFYAIDLKDIDHAGDMLFWIYQIRGKSGYGENVVSDLIDAFADIFEPHHKCRGGRKLDKGSELAEKYRDKLNRQEKILNDPNRKIN